MKKSSTKKLYAADFKTLLDIAYLPELKVTAKELHTHNIHKDFEYTANPKLNQKLEEQYGALIDQSFVIPMHIKWINKTVGHGVFTEIDLKRGDMVCEYTGVLCQDVADDENGYIWDYPTFNYEVVPGKKRRKKIRYCIDALQEGNFARFINHTIRKHQNVGVCIVPRNNLWHVIYVARKTIKAGQQLVTFYGTDYWRDRQIVPTPIIP